MKSVGEAMAFGRSFVEALQKAMRSLEQSPSQFWVHPTRPARRRTRWTWPGCRTTCGC
jgi:carbamoyl-phosphate synthase large subunit